MPICAYARSKALLATGENYPSAMKSKGATKGPQGKAKTGNSAGFKTGK
jgi:hypothetical protein